MLSPTNPPAFSLEDIALLLHAELAGGPSQQKISGLADIQDASPGDLVFAETESFLHQAAACPSSAIVTTSRLRELISTEKPLLVVENPRLAFIQVLQAFTPQKTRLTGIHQTAIIEQDVKIGESVSIAAYVTIGSGSELGDRVTIKEGVRIGEGVIIGADTILYPNVVIYDGVRIGGQCILHSGATLGADGFAFAPDGNGILKIPHIGIVELGDNVEVGANSCIDRARTGKTVIGSGTKIDNLVHVGHNVKIGRNCLFAAHVGIAGSVEIGDGVIFGGQAGVGDHIHIGSGARIGGQAGVIGDIKPGETVSGYPARPHRRKLREYAAVSLLPDFIQRIKSLEKQVKSLLPKEDKEQDG